MRTERPHRGATLELDGDGLTVVAVAPGGQAAAAGLEPGDRIVRIFGMPLTGSLREELIAALADTCLVGVLDQRTGKTSVRWLNLGEPDATGE